MSVVPCLHKQADHQCGTNARYVLDRCRCEPCIEARRQADRRRASYNAGVTQHPLVDAQPVRERVEWLIAHGMGKNRIAEVSGVPHGVLSKLIYGERGMPPSRRVRRSTARKVLLVELDVSDGAKVPGGEARRIVRELVARGWTKSEIGRRVTGPKAKSLQAADSRLVRAGTLRVLRRLMVEPVPLRRHPRGSFYEVRRDYKWRSIPPTTPGVPVVEQPLAASGALLCDLCWKPLADHSITAPCWRAA